MPFAWCLKELSIHVHRTWLVGSINRWVERMAVWGVDVGHHQDQFVKLLIQLVGEILYLSGKSRGISEISGCSNHDYYHNRGHQQHRLLQSVIILIIMFVVVLIPSCAVVLVLPVLKRVFTLSSLSLSFSSYSFCRIRGQYVCWINVSQSLKSLRIIRYCSCVYQC